MGDSAGALQKSNLLSQGNFREVETSAPENCLCPPPFAGVEAAGTLKVTQSQTHRRETLHLPDKLGSSEAIELLGPQAVTLLFGEVLTGLWKDSCPAVSHLPGSINKHGH